MSPPDNSCHVTTGNSCASCHHRITLVSHVTTGYLSLMRHVTSGNSCASCHLRITLVRASCHLRITLVSCHHRITLVRHVTTGYLTLGSCHHRKLLCVMSPSDISSASCHHRITVVLCVMSQSDNSCGPPFLGIVWQLTGQPFDQVEFTSGLKRGDYFGF